MLKIKSFFRINGIIFILFWLLLFFQPNLSLRIIIILSSIEILISWIIGLFVTRRTPEYNHRTTLFIISILAILLWFILLCIPEIWEIIASIAIVILWISWMIKWVFMIIDWIHAKEYWINNRWMLLAFWVLSIIFWIFLTTNAFLTLLVINILLWLGLLFLGILLIIRGFQADEKKLAWLEEMPSIEDYDDSDD